MIRGEFLGEGSADVVLMRGALITAGEWRISWLTVVSSSGSVPSDLSDLLGSDGLMSYSYTLGFRSPRYGEKACLLYSSLCHHPLCKTT